MKITNSTVYPSFEKKRLVIEFESQLEVDGFYALFNTVFISNILNDYGVCPKAIREYIIGMYPDVCMGGCFVIRNGNLEPIR